MADAPFRGGNCQLAPAPVVAKAIEQRYQAQDMIGVMVRQVDGIDRIWFHLPSPQRRRGGMTAIDQQGEAVCLHVRGGVRLVGVERLADAVECYGDCHSWLYPIR
jgi:hypothetical protein